MDRKKAPNASALLSVQCDINEFHLLSAYNYMPLMISFLTFFLLQRTSSDNLCFKHSIFKMNYKQTLIHITILRRLSQPNQIKSVTMMVYIMINVTYDFIRCRFDSVLLRPRICTHALTQLVVLISFDDSVVQCCVYAHHELHKTLFYWLVSVSAALILITKANRASVVRWPQNENKLPKTARSTMCEPCQARQEASQ